MIAAIPVVLMRPNTNWEAVIDKVAGRPEIAAGEEFIRINGRNSLSYVFYARWFCIPISVLGGWLCWRWASRLYSRAAGLLALGLWSFSPNVLAHGPLATADMSGTVFGLLACYLFWRWLNQTTWRYASWAGLALGLGLLGKITNLYLVPYLACFGAMAIVCSRRKNPVRPRKEVACQVAWALFVGWMVLHAGYGFQHALLPVKSFRFTSRFMAGPEATHETRLTQGGNRFADSWLGELPSPVPGDYLVGIDLQMRDFEVFQYSYLRGEWRAPGWPWYYLYAALIKVPVGTLLLLGLALAATVLRRDRCSSSKDELFVVLPALIVLTLVSSQTGMNRHFRYVLPAFPFVFIWLGKTAAITLTDRFLVPLARLRAKAAATGKGPPTTTTSRIGALACLLLSSVAVESLSVYPHSLSFFNVLVGPRAAAEHLTDSNIDWGQDFLFLQRWLADHRTCRPLRVIGSVSYPLESLGIGGGDGSVISETTVPEAGALPPLPGWYAVSVSRLYQHEGRYARFLRLRPVAMAGYSVYIYHVTAEDAERLRQNAGLTVAPGSGKIDSRCPSPFSQEQSDGRASPDPSPVRP